MRNRPQRNSGSESSTIEPRSSAASLRGAAHVEQQRARPRCRRRWRPAWRGAPARSSTAACRAIRRRDVPAEMDRGAEIAVQNLRQPDAVLLEQRQIEAHLVALGLDLLERRIGRQRHRGRIDRQDAQDAEQQRGDDEQDRYRNEQPLYQQLGDGREHSDVPRSRAAEAESPAIRSPGSVRGCDRTLSPDQDQDHSIVLPRIQPLPYLT